MFKPMSKTLCLLAIVGLVGCGANSDEATSTVVTRTLKTFNQEQVNLNIEYPVKRIKVDESQIIVFDVPVVYDSVEIAIERLETIRKNGGKEAYIILDSPGGSVFDGARLISYIKHSSLKVYTVCDGMCASMAAQIFSAGKKRYMTDKSVLMFHPASGGLIGTLEQMESLLTMIKRYVDRMDAEVAQRAGIDYNEFKALVLKEYWLETADALDKNLADEAVFVSYTRNSDLSLSVSRELKSRSLRVDDSLLTPGAIVVPSVKLQEVK